MKATTWNFSFPELTASIQQDNWDWAQHKKQPQKTHMYKKRVQSVLKKPSCALGMFPHLGGVQSFFFFCVNQKAFARSSANKKVLIIDDIQKPNIVHFTVKLNFLIKKKKEKKCDATYWWAGHTLT